MLLSIPLHGYSLVPVGERNLYCWISQQGGKYKLRMSLLCSLTWFFEINSERFLFDVVTIIICHSPVVSLFCFMSHNYRSAHKGVRFWHLHCTKWLECWKKRHFPHFVITLPSMDAINHLVIMLIFLWPSDVVPPVVWNAAVKHSLFLGRSCWHLQLELLWRIWPMPVQRGLTLPLLENSVLSGAVVA